MTVSAKTLHVSVQISAYFQDLKSNNSVSTQWNATKLCTVMAK